MRVAGRIPLVGLLALLGCGKAAERAEPTPVEAPAQASAELLGEYRLELGRPRAKRSETTRWCYLALEAQADGALAVQPWHPGPDHTFSCPDVRVSPSGLVSLVIKRAQAYAERRPDAAKGEIATREVFVPEEVWELSLRLQRDPAGEVVGLTGDALVSVSLEDGGQSRFKQRFRAVRVDEDELAQAEGQWDENRPPEAPEVARSFSASHGRVAAVPEASSRERSQQAAQAAQDAQLARATARVSAEKPVPQTVTPALSPADATVRPDTAPTAVAATATPSQPGTPFEVYALVGFAGLVCLPWLIATALDRRPAGARTSRPGAKRSVPPTRRQAKRTVPATRRRAARRTVPPTRRRAAPSSSGHLAALEAVSALSRSPRPEPSDDALWFKPGALQVHAMGASSEDLHEPQAEPEPLAFDAAPARSHLRLMIEDAWASESSADLLAPPALDDPPALDAPPEFEPSAEVDWDADAAHTIRDWGSESSGEFPAYTGEGSASESSSIALMAPPEPEPAPKRSRRPAAKRRRRSAASRRLKDLLDD